MTTRLNTCSPNTWIAVSCSALRHNFQAVRLLSGTAQVIAVVKANAFGHGALETARILAEAGADFFAVTTPTEALELRAAGISGRMLVFLPPLVDQIEALVENDLEQTVGDIAEAKAIADAAQALGKTTSVHLKIDSGMGRLGALPSESAALAQTISQTPGLALTGVYTHFARALEKDESATRGQFAVFQKVLAEIERLGVNPGLRHCANSAALVRFPEMRLDAVRPGTLLYGQYPPGAIPRTLDLRETWRMQTRIIVLRRLPFGSAIGYGAEFVTRRPTTVAVLSIGYADGFTVAPASASSGWRGLKNWLRPTPVTVTIRGKRAVVLGRVSMQICTVDVTDIPGVAVGDIVSVPARRITASARLPRLYLEQFDEQSD